MEPWKFIWMFFFVYLHQIKIMWGNIHFVLQSTCKLLLMRNKHVVNFVYVFEHRDFWGERCHKWHPNIVTNIMSFIITSIIMDENSSMKVHFSSTWMKFTHLKFHNVFKRVPNKVFWDMFKHLELNWNLLKFFPSIKSLIMNK